MDDALKKFFEDNHSGAVNGAAPTALPTLYASVSPSSTARSGAPPRSSAPGPVTCAATRARRCSSSTAGSASSTLECRVNILDGSDAPEQNLRLFQVMQAGITPAPTEGTIMWYGKPLTVDAFLQAMKDEGRLIYEFDAQRTYGLYGEAPTR